MNPFLLVLALVSWLAVAMTFTTRGQDFFDDQLLSPPRIHLVRAFFLIDGAILAALAIFL